MLVASKADDECMTTNEFMVIDWSSDPIEDLHACLSDYASAIVADPSIVETPNGAQLAEFCYQIRDEFARRHMQVILPF